MGKIKTIEIEVYGDEIVTPIDFNGKRINMIGLGCLFVPVNIKEELVKSLITQRCLFERSNAWYWNYEYCPLREECRRDWHDGNNCEIHHEELRNSRSSNSQRKIAKRWLDFLIVQNKKDKKLVYFNILYINLDVLEIDNFESKRVPENIYNGLFVQ